MNKMIRMVLVVASLAFAAGAQAQDSFSTAAGTSFDKFFTVTPSEDHAFAIAVSALPEQYSQLGIRFLNAGPSLISASDLGGNLVAWYFNSDDPQFSMLANHSYTLEIAGVTKPQLPGVFGVVSLNYDKGTVNPIPEPGEWALMLSGLGLVGVMVRRRRA